MQLMPFPFVSRELTVMDVIDGYCVLRPEPRGTAGDTNVTHTHTNLPSTPPTRSTFVPPFNMLSFQIMKGVWRGKPLQRSLIHSK
ncbi:Hypothetical protein SMAX5B_019019 [Scophthalmus maximus]|uniref:Uncharacterized protein n=1 Tax=Scophthalmus maximus TaxID=52904 RepID=A0A2U9C848_SCOMX|nr:Hypothetical protein SMAX5B_019019 [Scophthalmus maximus]